MGTGEHRISFDIQPEFFPELLKALSEWSKNPQGILYFKTVTTPESPKDKWTRYNKKIHALLDDVAELKNTKVEDIKKIIKDSLIKEGKIKTSLSELTEETQMEVITRLERILDDE